MIQYPFSSEITSRLFFSLWNLAIPTRSGSHSLHVHTLVAVVGYSTPNLEKVPYNIPSLLKSHRLFLSANYKWNLAIPMRSGSHSLHVHTLVAAVGYSRSNLVKVPYSSTPSLLKLHEHVGFFYQPITSGTLPSPRGQAVTHSMHIHWWQRWDTLGQTWKKFHTVGTPSLLKSPKVME